MANCGQCGRDVGCGCNLIHGSCASCYNKSIESGETPTIIKQKSRKRVVYKNQPDAQPITEFNVILADTKLTREEKLKRINDILEKARIQTNDNQL